MIDIGEKMISSGPKVVMKRGSLATISSKDLVGPINPYNKTSSQHSETGLVAFKGSEDNKNSIVQVTNHSNHTTHMISRYSENQFKTKEKKKEIIDFSTFNKHLYLKDNEFIYCKRVGNAIEFIECVYSELMPKDKKKKIKSRHNVEYITMSKNTVMLYRNGNSYIYSVPEWVDNFIKFKSLLQIRLFKNFRTAKLYELWKKFHKKSMKTLYMEKLKKRYHHIDDALLSGLMEIRGVLSEMSQINIFKLEMKDPVTLTKFQEDHKNSLKELDKTLEYYRATVKKLIQKACNTSYKKYKEIKNITLEDNVVNNKQKDKSEDRVAKTGHKEDNKFKSPGDANFVQNFLKDAMPYAQDATRRTHYKKLLRYIRVVDFLFNEAKYSMILNSLQHLGDKFTRLYDCLLNNWVDPPLLVMFDLPLKEQIHYIPNIDQVHKAFFEEFIQEKIYTVIYRKSFVDPQEFPNYMSCFEEVFEISVDQNSNLNLRIKEDLVIGGLFQKVRSTFDLCHQSLEKFTKEQLPILLNYNKFSNINFKSLEDNSRPEQLKELLDQFIIESKKISEMKLRKNLGIFQLNMGNMIEKVQRAPSKWISDMRELIPVVLVSKLKNLISILNTNLKRLSFQNPDLDNFIALKISVKEIQEQKDEIEAKSTEVNDIITIIKDDREIKIPEFDTKYIREKEALYVEFEKKLGDMGYFIDNNIAKYKKELKDNINKFDKEIKNMMEDLNVDTLNVYNEDNYSAIFYIENKSVQIKKLIDKKEFFRKQENLIEMDDKSNFENLDNLVYEYELKSKLWDSVREFQEMSKKWDNSQVMKINIPEMESLINNWLDIGNVALIDLEAQNVPKALLERTKTYQTILPIIKTFHNPNVNKFDRFTDMIKDILNIEFGIDDRKFSVERLLSIPELFDKIPELLELNKRADEEKKLRDIYKEVLDNYNAHKIPLKLERSSKQQNDKNADRWVITANDFEYEYEWIEEKLMTLKKTLLSPYCDIIRNDVHQLITNLLKYLHFIDEFFNYQRFVNTSEAIVFLNPEFAKEKPMEYKRFSNENTLKSLSKLLKENSILPRYIEYAHEKAFNSLKNANKTYEDLFSYIEDFLERKRTENLKFYFLSNDELLDIYSNLDSPEVRKKYIPKLIQGIKNIDLGLETDETIKVYTVEDELINIRYNKGKGSIKDLIDTIETEIAKKLKISLRSFKKDYESSLRSKSQKKPKEVIMDIIKNKENMGQAIFNFMYSFFIDALEKALNADDVFDKIIDIRIDSKDRKKTLINSLKEMNITKVERKILINQISLENYFHEIIKNLVREECNSTLDFNWQKILQFKIEAEQCMVKMFNFTFDYGFEYVGLHNNFIISPHTEKVYLTIANCFHLKRPFFVYGLLASGKKETIKTLAKIFGKNMYIFQCSEQFDVDSFYKQLYGCLKGGNWLSLDNVNLISIEMLSIIAQEIMMIYRTLSDTKEPSLLMQSGEKILLDKNTQIFCMHNVARKSQNLSGNIRNYFRLIGVCVPDLYLFVFASMKNLGLSKVKVHTKKITFLIEYLNTKIASLKFKRIGLSLFNKVLQLLEKDINRITESNLEKSVRKAFNKAFVPFMTNEENQDMDRYLNNVFQEKENSLFSYSSMINSDLDDLIKNATKNYNFKNEEYVTKIKDIIMSLEEKDLYLFVGDSLCGKSEALEIITSISKKLNKLNPSENPLIQTVKIFPKAYDSLFLFSENQRYSKIQFYNVFFYNQIKLFSELEKSARLKNSEEYSQQGSPEKRPKSDVFEFESLHLRSTEYKEASPIKILYFDGQIDPTWIDHLNYIYGDNKSHCMPNGDTIALSEFKVMFEALNLIYATPSFITRNFIVNFESNSMNWENILFNWIKQNSKIVANSELQNYVRGLFENYFPKIYEFILNNKLQCMNFAENFVMKNFITLFDSILPKFEFEDKKIGKRNPNMVPKIEIIKKSTLSIFIFSCAWTMSFFTNFILKTKIEKLISDIFKADDLKGPIFDYYIDEERYEFELWSYKIENNPDYKVDYNIVMNEHLNFTYNKIFVPTIENIPYDWLVQKILNHGKPVFYTGQRGVGKSLLINSMLNEMNKTNTEVLNLRYLMNYTTTTKKLENFLMDNLSYIKRDLIGDLYDRKVILFIDDCNLQKQDSYYSQSALECIRQILNINYLYDGKTNLTKSLHKLNILCCGNLVSYPKHFNMDRFIHSFFFVSQNIQSDESLVSVFKHSLEHHIKTFIPNTSSITSNQYVQATILLNEYMNKTFKQSPRKMHYVFTLRDVTKVFQSIHNFVHKHSVSDYSQYLEKLWFYECSRVYIDGMSKEKEVDMFKTEIVKIFNTVFKRNISKVTVFEQKSLFSYNLKNHRELLMEMSKEQKNQENGNEMIENPEDENNPKTDINNKKNLREYIWFENSDSLYELTKERLKEYYKQTKHRHITLNKTTFDLIIKITRIFQFNKGNLIMIGPTISGKLSITQFVAFMLGMQFFHLDESYLTSSKEFNLEALVKTVLINASYNNQPTVLFVNNNVLERDEVLDTINNMINTRKILNYLNLNKNAEKEFGFKLEENEVISRIEENLSIAMSVFPHSLTYKKLYYHYPYIAKHSNTLNIEKWNESTYTSFVRESLSNIDSLNSTFSDFASILVDTHHFIKSLAHEYSVKLMCKIEISSKNFTEMVLFYENNFKSYREILSNKKKRFENAVDVMNKTKALIAKMNEELERLEPDKAEHEKAIEEKKLEMSKLHTQKTKITNMKLEEEKPWQYAEKQKDEINDKIFKNLEEYNERVGKTARDLAKLEKNDLLEFKNYIDNHTLSKFILSQIYGFQGEASEWDSIKRNLDPKYIRNLLQIDFRSAPANLVEMVRETVAHSDFVTSEFIQKPFKTCGLFTDWFQALFEYFKVLDSQQDLMNEIEELNKKIAEHEKIIKNHTDNLMDLAKQITEIDKELNSRDKKKQFTSTQIEKRELIKKIGDELIVTANEKHEIWKDKKDILDSTLQNIEFYMLYISIYLNYAPAFNLSYRNKIKNFLYRKAEESNIPDLKRIDFYTLMLEFLDIRGQDRDLIFSLSSFDEYTKENLLIMKLVKKVPFIIDNNRLSKWTISEFVQYKEPKRLIFTKQYEPDFTEKVELALKDGLFLFIEQCDDKVYNVTKNLIKEEKVINKGKAYIMFDNNLKDYNDKFKLHFIKDKIDARINSKIWIESLVINFSPSKSQIRAALMKELSGSNDPISWNAYTKTILDILKENTKLLEVEDRIINIYNQFDFSGSIDKINSNQNYLTGLKNETLQHSYLLANIENQKDKLFKYQGDISKFKDLSFDASNIYKCTARFIFLDNIYNFSFAVFGKIIKDYYRDKVLSKDERDPEYTKEDLLSLILYVYDRIALLFSYDQRKLLLFELVMFYLSQKGEIPKTYKHILYHVKNTFFDKNLDENHYNEDSPIKNISKFEWNCLRDINDKSNFMFSFLLHHIQTNQQLWEKYLSEIKTDSAMDSSSEDISLSVDQEIESNSNILSRLIFLLIILPYRFEQLSLTLLETVIEKGLRVPRFYLPTALAKTSNRKIMLIIDNEYLAEKEIIIYYHKKLANNEAMQFYKILNLNSEISQSQFELINNAIKFGNLIIVRNIQYARLTSAKLFDILNDPKTVVHESFRIVFITKSNIILSNTIYENCILMNRNTSRFNNIKDTIKDSIEAIDPHHFEFLANRKFNIFSRKILFYFLIVHAILKQFHYYHLGIYNLPIEYSKKDFLNCLYSVSSYLQQYSEILENPNQNNDNTNNYLILVNIVFDSFYTNRLIYKEEVARVTKILMRYFEEDKFLNEEFYFLFKDAASNTSFEIVNDKKPIISFEEVIKVIDTKALEKYYNLIINVPKRIKNHSMSQFARDLFDKFSVIHCMGNSKDYIRELQKHDEKTFEMDRFASVAENLKLQLPDIISIADESSSLTFKVNKYNEYVNPVDESLKFEVSSYNDYLKRVYYDIEVLNKIFRGEIVLHDEYSQIMLELSHNSVPKKWKEPCFNYKRYHKSAGKKLSLTVWKDTLGERFKIFREWLLNSTLQIYHAPLFYNIRLFFFSITNYFSRKISQSPENVKLKLFPTKYYRADELFDSEGEHLKEISLFHKNKEIFFCNGFILDNAFFDSKLMSLILEKEENNDQTSEIFPIIGITYSMDDDNNKKKLSSDDEEEEAEEEPEESAENTKILNVPVYDRDNPEKFENVEPICYIELKYDGKYKEEFWISKAVKLTLDY